LKDRTAETTGRHLERMAERDQADRLDGCCPRWLLTELGAIELAVPQTRGFSASKWSVPTPEGPAISIALLRARPADAQGGQGAVADARAAGEPGHGHPGGPAAGCRMSMSSSDARRS
jgi:hypothetical protein